MASFNKVILMGNLTRDPQVRYTPSGAAVTDIGLAVNRTWFDKQSNSKKEEVSFIDVTLWGRQAEIAGEYLSKGRSVLIEGRLNLDQWDDKESGQKRSKLKVVCENMTMVGGRSSGGDNYGGGGGGGYSAPAPQKDRYSAPPSGDQGGYNDAPSDAGASSFYDPPADGGGADDVPF